MYIRIGNRIINTNHLVHALVEGDGLEVVLNMSTGDEMRLKGEEAEMFLAALPTYVPVMEE